MRVLGLVLFWLGAAVSVVTALALSGLPVRIELFAFDLDTRRERIALTLGAVMVAVIGLVIVRTSPRSQR
jgi:hypothetical protein